MSMNIYIYAKRNATTVVKGKKVKFEDVVKFDALQTPTSVTYSISRSGNPAQEYINWVMSCSQPKNVPVYADDDIFCKGKPVGYEPYDAHKDHVDAFRNWLDMCEQNGYKVCYEVS